MEILWRLANNWWHHHLKAPRKEGLRQLYIDSMLQASIFQYFAFSDLKRTCLMSLCAYFTLFQCKWAKIPQLLPLEQSGGQVSKFWCSPVRQRLSLVVFNFFSYSHCSPQSTLCIRTLRGHSLGHPSFVAVVHHSFTEINLYCISLRTTQYQKYLCAKTYVFTAQFM